MNDICELRIGSGQHLTAEDVWRVAKDGVRAAFSAEAVNAVNASRCIVEDLVHKGVVAYGITTGFGSFKDKIISREDVAELQKNLLRSHSCGVGPLFSVEEVRAMMLVRLHSLSQGYSGIRMETLTLACDMLNKGVIPVVPSKGSVGSSGDLAPLSHMGLVLMGEGEAWVHDRRVSGAEALAMAGLSAVTLQAKEGLAWNNGTSVMTGLAALSMHKCALLVELADIAAALTFEALHGCTDALDERIHLLRRQEGQQQSAKSLRRLLAHSLLVNTVPGRIQDGYSLRCAPQVHGAARDVISFVHTTVEREINAVTDNPLLFPGNQVLSGGNFHGEPIALGMDACAMAVAELANISERRIARMLDRSTNEDLPMFLVAEENAGLHSGFMIPQYVAAALVSENKVLAHPASVDSIPTSANQEDHVSMGTIAARKIREVIDNTETVLAIELLTAAQALEFRDHSKLGRGTVAAYRAIRAKVPALDTDRVLATDIHCLHMHLEQIVREVVAAVA